MAWMARWHGWHGGNDWWQTDDDWWQTDAAWNSDDDWWQTDSAWNSDWTQLPSTPPGSLPLPSSLAGSWALTPPGFAPGSSSHVTLPGVGDEGYIGEYG